MSRISAISVNSFCKKLIFPAKMVKTIFAFFAVLLMVTQDALSCTSAIIGADMNPSGRPLLWKLRDTSTTDNKIEYVSPSEGCLGYVALFNASDLNLEEAWMGMNEAGFAIMNTASYNIKDDDLPESEMDKEGFVMTEALKHCRTVDDFEELLNRLPRPLGVEANFGVIDSHGDGAYFETNNHSFVKYDLKEAPDHVLVRTNYSHSGRKNEGYGYIREANAIECLKPYIAERNVTPAALTEDLSRSFYHSLFDKDFLESGERWIIDQDFMPRYKSTATIVIEGCKPQPHNLKATKDLVADEYIMWTGMGYPPCSQIIPVWCEKNGVDRQLRGWGPDGRSEMCETVKARRDEVFPFHWGNGDKYIDTSVLLNKEGTGYLQVLVPENLETYRIISEKRDKKSN